MVGGVERFDYANKIETGNLCNISPHALELAVASQELQSADITKALVTIKKIDNQIASLNKYIAAQTKQTPWTTPYGMDIYNKSDALTWRTQLNTQRNDLIRKLCQGTQIQRQRNHSDASPASQEIETRNEREKQTDEKKGYTIVETGTEELKGILTFEGLIAYYNRETGLSQTDIRNILLQQNANLRNLSTFSQLGVPLPELADKLGLGPNHHQINNHTRIYIPLSWQRKKEIS